MFVIVVPKVSVVRPTSKPTAAVGNRGDASKVEELLNQIQELKVFIYKQSMRVAIFIIQL